MFVCYTREIVETIHWVQFKIIDLKHMGPWVGSDQNWIYWVLPTSCITQLESETEFKSARFHCKVSTESSVTGYLVLTLTCNILLPKIVNYGIKTR